jgi:hypothetical protein
VCAALQDTPGSLCSAQCAVSHRGLQDNTAPSDTALSRLHPHPTAHTAHRQRQSRPQPDAFMTCARAQQPLRVAARLDDTVVVAAGSSQHARGHCCSKTQRPRMHAVRTAPAGQAALGLQPACQHGHAFRLLVSPPPPQTHTHTHTHMRVHAVDPLVLQPCPEAQTTHTHTHTCVCCAHMCTVHSRHLNGSCTCRHTRSRSQRPWATATRCVVERGAHATHAAVGADIHGPTHTHPTDRHT